MTSARKNLAVTLVADGANPFKITLHRDTSIMPIRLGQTIAAGLLTLVAQGGVGPYAFTPGAIGSSGLAINANGSITGTATQAGHFEFIGEGQDSSSPDQIYQGTFEIQVEHLLNPIAFSPPDAEVGMAYRYAFDIENATGTLTYSTSSTLPDGLTLSADGVLSGTPNPAGPVPGPNPIAIYPIEITVSDSGSGDSIDVSTQVTLYQQFSQSGAIGNQPFLLNVEYTQPLTLFTGATNGKRPISWAVDMSSFAGSYSISGPSITFKGTTVGTYTIPFSATDALGQTISGSFDLQIVLANQQIAALDATGAMVLTNPAALQITSDDGSVDVDTQDDGAGGVTINLRATGGGDSGGPIGSISFHRDGSYGGWGLTPGAGTDTINLNGTPIGDSLKILVDGVETFPVFTGSAGYFGSTFVGTESIDVSYLYSGSASDSYYTYSGAPPTDPLWSNVAMLLPFDETSGSQSCTDAKTGDVWTFGGSTATSNSSPLCGPCSLVCAGNGGSNSHSVIVGAQTGPAIDAVWECQAAISTTTALDTAIAVSNDTKGVFQHNATIGFYLNTGYILQSGNLTLGTKTHIALVISATRNALELYAAGVLQGSVSPLPFNFFQISWIATDNASEHHTGKLDDFRVTNGDDRGYTPSGFTPPPGPFPQS